MFTHFVNKLWPPDMQ